MIDFLQTARARGEEAMRRGAWAFAGAALFVLALGFAAAAVVEALKLIFPAWAALAAGALVLIVGGAVCAARARAPKAEAAAVGSLNLNSESAGPAGPSAAGFAGDWRGLLNEALIRESRDKPARAAAIAAIAGLILGAIEGLDDSANGK